MLNPGSKVLEKEACINDSFMHGSIIIAFHKIITDVINNPEEQIRKNKWFLGYFT